MNLKLLLAYGSTHVILDPVNPMTGKSLLSYRAPLTFMTIGVRCYDGLYAFVSKSSLQLQGLVLFLHYFRGRPLGIVH